MPWERPIRQPRQLPLLGVLVGPEVLIQMILSREVFVACRALVLKLTWWNTLVLPVDM